MTDLAEMAAAARACTLCAQHLPLGPRPILRVSTTSRLLITSQAPGTRAHLSGVPFGWAGFLTLSAILAAATFTGMLVFTWLALVGLEKIQVKKFERYEAGLLGALFTVVGGLIMVLEH